MFSDDGIASFCEERVFLAQTTFLATFVEFHFPHCLVTRGSEVPANGEWLGTPTATTIGFANSRGDSERVAGIDGIDGRHCWDDWFGGLVAWTTLGSGWRGNVRDDGGFGAKLLLTERESAVKSLEAVVAYAYETHWVVACGVELDGGVVGRVIEGEIGGVEKSSLLGAAVLAEYATASATMVSFA